jgi:DNA-binding NarL/FixJ family response regulator
MPKRVLIVEDHALVALSLSLALTARGWIVETTDGPTATDITDHAQRFGPRSVLLDIRLGDAVGSGVDLIGPLRATGAEIVMLTAETDQDVLASCLEAGAIGWIGKHASLDEVETALGDVREGRPLVGCSVREAMLEQLRSHRAIRRTALSPFEHLTQREREVLTLLIDGLAAEEIAETRCVALTTVRSQIRSVLRKLGVRSQLAAVARASRAGWALDAAELAVL